MKKRTFLRLLVSAILALGLLALLASYLYRSSHDFDKRHPALRNPLQSEEATPPVSGESSREAASESASSGPSSEQALKPEGRADAGMQDMTETEIPEQSRRLPAHRILFVGDSRTVGLDNALDKLLPDDPCLFVGKVGEGCSWFLQEGEAQMADAIAAAPDAPVVLNLGVNDPDQVDQYLDTYRNLIEAFPDTDFWFLSVNPVQRDKMIENGASEEALDLVTETNINRLNMAIQRAFPNRYLDSASMLKLDGFETVDGLHYTRQTYLKIHRFVVSQLFREAA